MIKDKLFEPLNMSFEHYADVVRNLCENGASGCLRNNKCGPSEGVEALLYLSLQHNGEKGSSLDFGSLPGELRRAFLPEIIALASRVIEERIGHTLAGHARRIIPFCGDVGHCEELSKDGFRISNECDYGAGRKEFPTLCSLTSPMERGIGLEERDYTISNFFNRMEIVNPYSGLLLLEGIGKNFVESAFDCKTAETNAAGWDNVSGWRGYRKIFGDIRRQLRETGVKSSAVAKKNVARLKKQNEVMDAAIDKVAIVFADYYGNADKTEKRKILNRAFGDYFYISSFADTASKKMPEQERADYVSGIKNQIHEALCSRTRNGLMGYEEIMPSLYFDFSEIPSLVGADFLGSILRKVNEENLSGRLNDELCSFLYFKLDKSMRRYFPTRDSHWEDYTYLPFARTVYKFIDEKEAKS